VNSKTETLKIFTKGQMRSYKFILADSGFLLIDSRLHVWNDTFSMTCR